MLTLTKTNVQLSEIFAGMHTVMIDYLINNFAEPLGLCEPRPENIHHFVDGLMAHRVFFYSLQMWDRVDEINYYLDELARMTDPECKLKPAHHDHMYRTPIDLDFLVQYNLTAQTNRQMVRRRISPEEVKYLEDCKTKNAF